MSWDFCMFHLYSAVTRSKNTTTNTEYWTYLYSVCTTWMFELSVCDNFRTEKGQ